MKAWRWAAAAVVGALSSLAHGATLYVRTDGSDTGCSGTANAAAGAAAGCAFATVQRAANVVAAGDTVSIQPGTYPSAVTLSRSGTASAAITFVASGAVVLRSNLKLTGSYLVVDGVTVSPPSAGGYGAVVIAGQHNTLKNALVTNYGASAGDQATAIILDTAGAFNTVERCTIRDLDDIDVFHINGHDQTIRHNHVTNVDGVNYALNHTDFVQTWGWSGSSSYNVLIEGNLVTDSDLQLGNITTDGNPAQRDWTFRNNVFANVGAALFSGLPGTRYYNNVFYKVGRAQGYAISLYTQPDYSSVGVQIANNAFIDCGEDVNFHSAAVSDVTLFTNNYFAELGGASKTNGERMGQSFINGGNAGFVNAAAHDFHLQSGSVLVNRGADLSSSFTTDRDGRVRTAPWDIGAYELGGGSLVAPPSNLRIVP